MKRSLMLVAGWAAATAAAVAVAWAGVQMVSGRVVDPLPVTALPPSASPSTEPSPTGRDVAAPEIRSYETVGGSVTLRFEPGQVTVLSAVPRPGFHVESDGSGTAEAKVAFESEEHRSRVRGWWEGGARDHVEERADDDDGERDD